MFRHFKQTVDSFWYKILLNQCLVETFFKTLDRNELCVATWWEMDEFVNRSMMIATCWWSDSRRFAGDFHINIWKDIFDIFQTTAFIWANAAVSTGIAAGRSDGVPSRWERNKCKMLDRHVIDVLQLVLGSAFANSLRDRTVIFGHFKSINALIYNIYITHRHVNVVCVCM